MSINLNQCFICDKNDELFICRNCCNEIGKKEVIVIVKSLNIPKSIKTDIYRHLRNNIKKRKDKIEIPNNDELINNKPFVKIEVGTFLIEP